jgi:hypothetical protein
LEEAKGIRDDRSALADAPRHLVVGKTEVLDELLIGAGLVQRVQILPLQVLDEGLLQTRDVVDDPEHGRDGGEAGSPSSTIAAFSGDDLVLARSGLSHEDRLEDPDGLDRVDEGSERLFVELLSRLVRVRLDLVERKLDQIRGGRTGSALGDECP